MLRSMLREKSLAVPVAGVLMFALAACSSPSASSSSAASGPVEVLVFGYDAGVQAWADQTVKAFNTSHSDGQLKITVVPPDQLQQLLTTRVQGGNPPDISSAPSAWVPAFASAGALTDWSSTIGSELISKFDSNLIKGSRYDDKLYSLPYLSSARALFYNKDQFAKAGISAPPATWGELVQQAANIRAVGAAKFAFSLQGTGNETFAAWFPYFYWSYGGAFTTSGGKIGIDKAACVQSLTQLRSLVTSKATEPNPTSFDITEQMGAFTSGEASMTVSGPWLIGMLDKDKKINYGVAPLPGGTTQTTLGVTDGWVQFKNSKHAAKAAEVAKYLLSPTVEDGFVKGRGMLPTLQAGFDATRYQSGPLQTFASMLPKASFVPLDPSWTKLSNQGSKALQSMYVNGTSPADVCIALAGIVS